MANRTVQIKGQGYGSGTCSASVTFNGNLVFSGPIPTVDSNNISYLPQQQATLLEFQVPVSLDGTFPVSITFTGGNAVFLDQVFANYTHKPNPVFSEADYATLISGTATKQQRIAIYTAAASPALSAADIDTLNNGTDAEAFAVLTSHGLSQTVSAGAAVFHDVGPIPYKTNVVINGVAGEDPAPSYMGDAGEWGWKVAMVNGTGTIAFDLNIGAGLE